MNFKSDRVLKKQPECIYAFQIGPITYPGPGKTCGHRTVDRTVTVGAPAAATIMIAWTRIRSRNGHRTARRHSGDL